MSLDPKVNLFIVGAQKAGTTWLYKSLKNHPQIQVPAFKEPEFFSMHYEKGIRHYHEKYYSPIDANATYRADFSPFYWHIDQVPERIHRYNADAKILVVLRHPIDRMYSQFKMRYVDGRTLGGIAEDFQQYDVYTAQGMYAKNIKRYLSFFPVENIHIFFFEKLKADPRSFLSEILCSLNLEVIIPGEVEARVNYRYGVPKNFLVYNTLKRIYKSAMKNEVLSSMVQKHLRGSGLQAAYRKFIFHKGASNLPPFPALMKAKYKEVYLNDLLHFPTSLKNIDYTYLERYMEDLNS